MSDKKENEEGPNPSHERKEGFGRKHLNPVRDAKGIANATRKQAQKDIAFTTSACGEFTRRLKGMFVYRGKKAKKEDLEDFDKLLSFWGTTENDLPKVKKAMRVSILTQLFVMVIAGLGLVDADGLYLYILLSMLVVGCLLKMVMTYWQLWVLSRGKYVSFKDWFTLNF